MHLKSVTIESLETVLKDIEALAELSGKELTREIEQYNAVQATSLAEYHAETSIKLETFRSVISCGQSALKSATLINGGAAVALLAFIGHVWGKDLSSLVLNGLSFSLLLFVFGVLCSAIASGTTYLAQAFYDGDWDKTAQTINAISILLVLGSYVLFFLGAYKAYSIFLLNGI